VACIGPITARSAAEAGLTVQIVAREHTAAGLVDALVEWQANRAGADERQ
jgi:uroporphyrinogen-III synthase